MRLSVPFPAGKGLLILMMLTALLARPLAAGARQETPVDQVMMALGSAPVKESDVAAAREAAIGQALRSAVEAAAANTVPLAGMVENFQGVTEFLRQHSGEFIQGYKVLAEAQTGEGYAVMVKATVAAGTLQTRLQRAGILRTLQNLPRVMVLFLPNEGEASVFVSPAREAIMAAMVKNGYDVVSTARASQPDFAGEAVGGILEEDIGEPIRPGAASAQPVSLEEALVMAGEARADVLILGSLSLTSIYSGGYENTAADTLMIIANAYRVQGARQIVSTVERVRLESPASAALERLEQKAVTAGTRVGESMALQLSQAWQEVAATRPSLEVIVTGAERLSDLVLFRRLLKEMPRVQDVQTRERSLEFASLDVAFEGSARELADGLAAQISPAFRIHVAEVTPNRIRVALTAP